ncbi:MAG TPA: TIGR00266 family protein, partial [Thiothrix sp.]|nr:TIGR00266 family protein [Thiothrix sp.]
MTDFMLNGEKEPFLIIQMNQGDKVFAESDSLLAMQDGIEVKGQMRGGFLSSMMRAVSSEED